MRNTTQNWGWMAKSLHWIIFLLILAQIVLGKVAHEMDLSPQKLDMMVWHKSLGITVLALILLRLAWRWINPTPALPSNSTAFERVASKAVHSLLYIVALAIPISGWVVNSAANIPFKVFRVIPLPDITRPSEQLQELAEEVHEVLVGVLLVLLAIHIAAALRHHFGKKNNVLKRMLPLSKPGSGD